MAAVVFVWFPSGHGRLCWDVFHINGRCIVVLLCGVGVWVWCGVFLLGAFWVAVGGVLASVLPFFTGCWAAFCKCVAYSVLRGLCGLRGWCGLPGGRGWCVWAAVVGGGRVFAGVVREASAAVVAADACRCAVLPGRVCPGGASPVCVGCVLLPCLCFCFYSMTIIVQYFSDGRVNVTSPPACLNGSSCMAPPSASGVAAHILFTFVLAFMRRGRASMRRGSGMVPFMSRQLRLSASVKLSRCIIFLPSSWRANEATWPKAGGHAATLTSDVELTPASVSAPPPRSRFW